MYKFVLAQVIIYYTEEMEDHINMKPNEMSIILELGQDEPFE